jgi:hypothetical protein
MVHVSNLKYKVSVNIVLLGQNIFKLRKNILINKLCVDI